ncbi:MAG: calcium/sodium antiporter, partial [Peptococcaceae bacterium]
MSVLVVVLLFLLGILLIVKGGDLFVDASTWIAVKSGIPKFIIGATIVSLATTLPELLTSAIATMDGKTGIAVGNAVGSVTANVGLIMGISVVCLPAVIQRNQIAFKGILMILACLLLYLLSSGGQLQAGPSMLLLVLFAVFIAENLYTAKKSMQNEKNGGVLDSRNVVLMNIAKFVGGAAGIVIGAQLLVNNGSELARILGVPESIIGATLIAVGTSLPELVTTVTALVKRQASLSIGNILGANIIDLTMILPICSILAGGSLEISTQASLLDLPFCLAVCFLAVLPPLFVQRFFRLQGVAL